MSDIDEMDEVISEFLVESGENLDQLDNDLVALEEDPSDLETLSSIFRTIHTIKGTCGFLGFEKLEKVSHVGENLLSKLREGELELNEERTSALLAMVDAIRQMLSEIEKSGNDGEEVYRDLIKKLTSLQENSGEVAQQEITEEVTENAPEEIAQKAPVQVEEVAPEEDAVAQANEEDDSDEMAEVIGEFLVESAENLDQLDNDLVALEENPSDLDTLSSIFRTIHTIKGTCGFLGFEKLEKVSHVGENLLSKLRDGVLELNEERTSALLAMLDAIRQMLSEIENNGSDGEDDYPVLVDNLTRLQGEGAAEAVPAAQPAQSEASQDAVTTDIDLEEAQPKALGKLLVEAGDAKPAQVAKAVQKQLEGDERAMGEILVKESKVDQKKVDAAVEVQSQGRGKSPVAAESNIRVSVGLLDKLMNLVGELVLTRNQILQYTTTQEDASFASASQRLSLVASELQEGVMQTRMQPIGSVWSKFPRVVRDLSHSLDKQIRIVMEGKETELDKTIIEAIKDPLTHLVRNSVDHGIEKPEVRTARGKPAEGTLTLRSYHEGGQVNIEICDDGGGIDPERLKKKAVDGGSLTTAQAERMSDREAFNLIFQAGFSTAEKVTNVSGRGVGMDVVKTNIEKIGGVIEIQSSLGEGTTLKIKIPLTLAIIPALTVTSQGDRYAIPQINLVELLLLEGERARTEIESIQGVPVHRLRGNLLPLVYLNKVLWGDEGVTKRDDGEPMVNIVVLQAGEQQFGLVVDDICDTQEIVVKPLGEQLKDIHCLAGSTIMGDGTVALILDAFGIAETASLISEMVGDKSLEVNDANSRREADRQMLLLLQNPDGGRMAAPMSDVARLEDIQCSSVEQVGEQRMVQYRGEIIPLIDVFATLPERRNRTRPTEEEAARVGSGSLQVVVYSCGTHDVGLIVDQILDVIEEAIEVTGQSTRQGVLGTAVIQERVTELINIEEIVHMSNPNLRQQMAAASVA